AEDWITSQNNQTTIITGTGVCDETQPINSRAAVVSIASSNSSIEGFTITGGGASGINAGGSVTI
ncbi:MAG: hypothetical protein GWN07_21820, partial [Actinobacteria bacterium]|nr:hypothetical protein [Actinomycetota bacterium]